MSTAVNLDTLPIDIKVTILSFLPNLRTLNNLRQACPSYKTVYKAYRKITASNILYNDALANYARESTWLACYHNKLYDPKSGRNSLKIALEAMLEYILYPNTVPRSTEITGDESYNDNWHGVMAEVQRIQSNITLTHEPPEQHKINAQSIDIIQNHRTIMGIYERLATSKLKLQNSQQITGTSLQTLPTAEEEHRIVIAIYRFFIAVNLKTSIPDDYQSPFEDVLRIWGFWGVVAVRAVRDFFQEQISRMEDNFSAIPDGLSGRRAKSGGVVKSSAVSKPVLPTCVIALHEFPDNFLTWIDPAGYFRRTAHINNRITSMLNSMRENNSYEDRDLPTDDPTSWGDFSLYFAHLNIWARRADDTQSGNHDYRFRDGEELPIQRSRPRTRNKDALVSTLEVQSWDSIGQARLPPDPYIALWDLWRLKKLGYHYCDWQLKRTMSWEYDNWDQGRVEWSQDIYYFAGDLFLVPLSQEGGRFIGLDTYLRRLRRDSYASDEDAERMSLFKTPRPKKRGRNGKPMKERGPDTSVYSGEEGDSTY